MNSYPNPLSDKEFREQFEGKTLDPIHFTHLGHMRIAWLYLIEYELDIALKHICRGIKQYAESLGDSSKFNLTLTDAMVRIMARRTEFRDNQNWEIFLAENNDLIDDFLSILLKHYSKGLLFSDEARTSLIRPDIKAI